ncbi:Lsr2 protein [Rhodococcus sp. SMB37]|uniref:histone-like nucleoid-structuring protein Lsr2 n=1 Tax=Rhodococcus sp. SMB37 TaxID=2512213 RepID=UPI0010EA24DD|nr:Lsr2 family protein [Rhodococcus sp. SMB37]TCN53561.1 Lsr2 protein [Rhodococcus sp. SMB37]
MQKEIVEYFDDLDGRPIDEGLAQTIRFTVDDVQYEIDLRPAHVEQFRADMARWIAAARLGARDPHSGRTRRATATAVPSMGAGAGAGRDRYQLAAVRDWARGQGIAVSSRGRVSRRVLEQFDAAHAVY